MPLTSHRNEPTHPSNPTTLICFFDVPVNVCAVFGGLDTWNETEP